LWGRTALADCGAPCVGDCPAPMLVVGVFSLVYMEEANVTSGLRLSVHAFQCADEDGDSETRPCAALVSHARHQFVTVFFYIFVWVVSLTFS
jgi:hypothetical protein